MSGQNLGPFDDDARPTFGFPFIKIRQIFLSLVNNNNHHTGSNGASSSSFKEAILSQGNHLVRDGVGEEEEKGHFDFCGA